MNKQVVVGMIALMSSSLLSGHSPIQEILDVTTDVTFNQFCAYIAVPAEQLRDFATFYETQTKKIKRVRSSATRQARTQELRDKGRSALEVEEPTLYAAFKACENGMLPCESPRACVAQNARLFLTRYGAWHEFKRENVRWQTGMWAKVKDFARGSRQKIAAWFGGSSTDAQSALA